MDAPLPQKIEEALALGVTVLTGNQRAARTLHHRFDLHHQSLGLTQWESPAILAWDTWTAHIWHQLLLDGHADSLLLNRAQEHALWRGIIASDPEALGLRTPDSLADLAIDAYGRLCAWRGHGRLRSAGISADTRAFTRWATAFDRRCRSNHYLPQAQLEAELANSPFQLTLPPKGYLLVGFDTPTPAQQHLLEAVRSAGIPLEVLALSEHVSPANLVTASDEPSELHIAARWLRSHLEQYPNARIALIVPALEDYRARIDRTLRKTLSPELEDVTATGISPYEFSLGVPIHTTPIVATALQLLQWALLSMPTERVSQLLLSPYFAAGLETSTRAELDAWELRKSRTLRPDLTLEGFLRIVESSKRTSRLPHLVTTLRAMLRSVTVEALATNEPRSAASWADAVRSYLVASGWAGSRPDDSIEFQTRRKWDSLLDELATLDFEGQRHTFPEILSTLTRLARQTLFAPESRNTPIQVMSPLEAAGSTFDALWFLRAGDLSWPQTAAASPLLGYSLQRELHMPGAQPTDDAAEARRVTQRLFASAPIVFTSFAQHSELGAQRPSPTLTSLTQPAPSVFLSAEGPAMPVSLEAVADNGALPPPPDVVLRGGATLLKLQAACGFRAFAEQRLYATAIDTISPGMDARERGNSVHVALQRFWNEVRDQATLRGLTDDARREILDRAIEHALSRTDAVAATNWDTAYLDVQRQRLRDLLDPWLLAELERKIPFTVIEQETTLRDARIGPLRLTLRVDRVDSTEFGNVILDYKTGEARPAAWLTDRPDEPQLPLYAVLSPDPEALAGVAFAQVRAGKDRSLTGYQTEDGILLKPTKLQAPTLSAQLEDWHRILTQLAEDFYRGDLRVHPKQYPTTCQYCAQRILCRLDPSTLVDLSSDENQESREDQESEHG